MTTLSLGVWDIPYADADNSKPAATKPRKGGKPRRIKRIATTTTGDVAEYLERKYHIYEIFFEIYRQRIADEVAEGMKRQIEALFTGAPVSNDPFVEVAEFTRDAFRRFISSGEMETLGYPGVPTKAAKDRRSLRFKLKIGEEGRVSFYDTGLFEASQAAELKA